MNAKGGLYSEDTGKFLRLQHKYSKSLSWAENLNFPPKTVNNLFKFSPQDSDLEYLCWRRKNFPVSSDLKPPLIIVLRTIGYEMCVLFMPNNGMFRKQLEPRETFRGRRNLMCS